MKILHVVSENSWRGGEQQVAYLLEECAKQNIGCYVACRRHSAFERFCIQHQVKFISLPFLNQFDIYTAWQLSNFCRKNNIDLLHLHSANAHGMGVLAWLLGSHTPMIVTRRVIFPIKNYGFSKFKYNHPAVKAFICVSNAVKNIVDQVVEDKRKMLVIYDGIDVAKFSSRKNNILRSQYNLREDAICIGSIAALETDKDPFTFIHAAEEILKKNADIKFFMMGEGSLRPQLQHYIQQHHLVDHVILTGFLSNIPHLLPELDILVLTSRQEGLGTTLLDAMICQVPVVATQTGGIPEVVIDEDTGLLAPIGNGRKIAEQVSRLLENSTLKHYLITNAKQLVLTHFTKEKMAAATVSVYRKCIEVISTNCD